MGREKGRGWEEEKKGRVGGRVGVGSRKRNGRGIDEPSFPSRPDCIAEWFISKCTHTEPVHHVLRFSATFVS